MFQDSFLITRAEGSNLTFSCLFISIAKWMVTARAFMAKCKGRQTGLEESLQVQSVGCCQHAHSPRESKISDSTQERISVGWENAMPLCGKESMAIKS